MNGVVQRMMEPAAGTPAAALPAARLLHWVLFGAACLLNSFLSRWIYPDNPAAADVFATLGALVLMAPIVRIAVRDLRRRELHMNELAVLAVLAAFAQGDHRLAGGIALFMLVALLIETRTAEGAHAAVASLVQIAPLRARVVGAGGGITEVPAAELAPGARILIRPGDTVPADAAIAAGRSTLDQAAITGESVPAEKAEGDEVFAGTLNLTGAIEAVVTRVGPDTTLGKVRKLILDAEKTRLPILLTVDRYVGFYTPAVLMICALTWLFTHDMARVVSLLVIACPIAVVIATPTAMVAALSAAARLGLLVKHVADLETVSRTTAFVFDKTGTLTTGALSVTKLHPAGKVAPAELVRLAAAVERASNHPAAKAVLRLAAEAGVAVPQAADVQETPGLGVAGDVEGRRVLAGRLAWLQAQGVRGLDRYDAKSQADGNTTVFVAVGGETFGWISLEDGIRPRAADALRELAALGVRRLAMMTGDREPVARRVAEAIGCAEVRAECLPQDKVRFIEELRAAGHTVTVVGDGVNDAPALAAGDAGIAMGAAGSDVAVHAAAIALMNNELDRLPFLLRLARRCRAVIYQNLAAGLAIIVGGLVLSGMGALHPLAAALIQTAGSLAVVLNSARLIRAGEYLEVAARPPPGGGLAPAGSASA